MRREKGSEPPANREDNSGRWGITYRIDSMKKTARIAVIIFAVVVFASTHAQPKLECTTIVFEYIGKSDRPFFPIIISSSSEEAEWYKQKLFIEPLSSFADVYIVGKSTMKEITDIPLPNENTKRSTAGFESRTSPALHLVLASGHDSREVTVEAAESVLLLREIKKRVSEYPPLVEQLARIEERMDQYLKHSH